MENRSTSHRRESFLNGLASPILGIKAIDKQTELNLNAGMTETHSVYFALGHMLSGFPLITVFLFVFFTCIDSLKLYDLL